MSEMYEVQRWASESEGWKTEREVADRGEAVQLAAVWRADGVESRVLDPEGEIVEE